MNNYIVALSSLMIFSASYQPRSILIEIPHVENEKIITKFKRDEPKIRQIIKDYRFVKSAIKISSEPGISPAKSGELLVTYRLASDTIQYYQSSSNRILFYCSFKNAATYSKYISILSLDKRAIIPAKYQKSNRIIFELLGGSEDMRLTFRQNKVSSFSYRVYTDSY